jgi:hypothetical protein
MTKLFQRSLVRYSSNVHRAAFSFHRRWPTFLQLDVNMNACAPLKYSRCQVFTYACVCLSHHRCARNVCYNFRSQDNVFNIVNQVSDPIWRLSNVGSEILLNNFTNVRFFCSVFFRWKDNPLSDPSRHSHGTGCGIYNSRACARSFASDPDRSAPDQLTRCLQQHKYL